MQIPIAPGITLNMGHTETEASKLAEDQRQALEAIEKLKEQHHKTTCELIRIDALISGAEGRLLQLRGNQLLKEREKLHEQRAMTAGLDAVEKALQPRPKMTAQQHNAFEGGRW